MIMINNNNISIDNSIIIIIIIRLHRPYCIHRCCLLLPTK